MSLAISPITPAVAALAADLGVALQPGTIVNAQVLEVLDANLVRIAIANLTLDVTTAKPLQPGQSLQLAVSQSANGLSLTPPGPDAAASLARGAAVIVDDIPFAARAPARADVAGPVLTPAETRAVALAAQTAVTKQAGLSPLFANLSAAVASGSLPQPVLLAAAQLLGLRLPSGGTLAGGDIKSGLQSSGLVLEASLASPTLNASPDLKSTLLVLRQALSTWLGPDPTSIASPHGSDVSLAHYAAASNGNAEESAASTDHPRTTNAGLPAAAWQALGGETDVNEPVAGMKNLLAAQLFASALRGPAVTKGGELDRGIVAPPVRGALPSPQPVAAPSLAPDAEPSTIARQLFADADGALARQTLLQIASLPDRGDPQVLRTDPPAPRWNFEMPFITPQGTAMAQFEIARDGGHESGTSPRVWRARFSLDIEPAGPVHALIAFGGDVTSVKMWAERPATAAQLRASIGQLGRSFDRAELKAGDIVIADGAPAPARPPSAGHFLSRAT